jgi:hypothetical protein
MIYQVTVAATAALAGLGFQESNSEVRQMLITSSLSGIQVGNLS